MSTSAQPQPASPPATPPRTRPGNVWWIAVAALWVLVPVLAVAGALKYQDLSRGPFTLVDPSSVRTHGKAFSVWSNVKPTNAQCALVEFDGQEFEMRSLPGSVTATVNRQTIYAVATAPKGLLPLTYALICVGTGAPAYWTSPPVDTGAVTSFVVSAGGVALLAALASIGLPVWQRSNRRKEQRAEYDRLVAQHGPPPGLGGLAPGFEPATPGHGWPPRGSAASPGAYGSPPAGYGPSAPGDAPTSPGPEDESQQDESQPSA